MKEYIPAIAAIIAGIFAIVSAFIAWRLKNSSDERARQLALDNQRRDEIKQLYTGTFTLFENAIRQVLNKEEPTLAQAFSENNAKIHLLAPEHITAQYSEVASLLESWSKLHFKASPRQMRVGEHTVTILQAPDPTAEYKEPANAEYQKLHEEMNKLIDLMRTELNSNA